jgi:hypothetical protein
MSNVKPLVRASGTRHIITDIPETLEEFGGKLDAVLGYESSIADAVRGYCLGRDILAVTDSKSEWRTGLDAVAKHFHDAKIGPTQNKAIRAIRTGGKRRVITAERVKNMNPELWAASRVQDTRLALKGPQNQIFAPIYTGTRVFSALEWMRKNNAEAKALQATARTIVNGVAEDMDWTPGQGWTTSDGWQILRYLGPLTFSVSKLRELVTPEEAEQYQEERVAASGVYYRLEEIVPADDLDEFST